MSVKVSRFRVHYITRRDEHSDWSRDHRDMTATTPENAAKALRASLRVGEEGGPMVTIGKVKLIRDDVPGGAFRGRRRR